VSVLHVTCIGHVCDVFAWDMCVCSPAGKALHFIDPFTKQFEKAAIGLVMSTHLSLCMEHCLTGQIFTKFHVGDFY
jgi:hypothetical protein